MIPCDDHVTLHLMKRVIEPEWLDELPQHDPRARRSRLELRRLNGILRHERPLARALSQLFACRDRPCVADLGAGDGSFALRLASRLPRPGGCGEFLLIDRHKPMDDDLGPTFACLGWTHRFLETDVFHWLDSTPTGRFDAIVSNLFLHHLPGPMLRRLFQGIAARTSRFAACETRRSLIALAASGCVGMIGCRAITRHDAIASVRAGFQDVDLTRLWPDLSAWQIEEHRLGWCSHWFMAQRRSCPEP